MYIIAVIILLLIWALIEQNLLMTTKYLIASPKLPREFADTSFVILADLHNHSFGKNNQRLIKKIDKLSPDFIIVAGDMINKDEPCVPSNAFLLLKVLAKKYKIYYSIGNHEKYVELLGLKNRKLSSQVYDNRSMQEMQKKSSTENKTVSAEWSEYREQLKNTVTFLDNASIMLTKNQSTIRITGLTIDREYFERGKTKPLPVGYIDKLLGKSDQNHFQLLIAHNPLYFQDYVDWGADLTVSGHLHGGLVRLPIIKGILSPQVRFFPKYDSGRFSQNGKEMIVSRGLGSHSVMFRLFNPPELIFVNLKK
jgi:predicted MPP superfamily phosphohydrolase